MNGIKAGILCMLVAWVWIVPTAGAATKSQEIDRLVTKFHQLRKFNGTVLVADEKGLVLKKGYGSANFEWQVPNTPDTKFRIGSVTKQFTSMVIMQLVAEGKLTLDDKVTKHLPDYRKDTGDRITIAQLLHHTTGLPNYTSAPGFFENESRTPYPVADFVRKFCSGDLEFEPGSKMAYSNSGYFLLGAIIEKVTGQTYAQALQQRIFDPLGMKSSGYDVSATVLPKRASGYTTTPSGYVNAPYLDMGIPHAAGAMYSTVEDLYRWDRALYLDTLLPAALKERMFTPALNDYALGWVRGSVKLHDDKTELASISHNGGINGFSSLLVRVPDKKEVVILLDNTSRGPLMELATGALSILHGIPPRQPRASIGELVVTTLEKSSVTEAIARYRTLKATKADAYDFSANELNNAGYRLLRSGRVPDAIEVFKLNVEMFPADANTYDSLGEAYLTNGNKELAITNYRRSLELDPANTNAVDALKKLQAPAATR
ncbi:serine hydrolase [Pyxidicoccus trucidator]|uniref:serine hydrolase n=1 Tax=Pyxidicoccus trucidator TaxID=2709662 RepID=UPI0013DCB29C|nr:serine hydrolase [Pyxidicoccus trucidator]